jgi:hypothetical protein
MADPTLDWVNCPACGAARSLATDPLARCDRHPLGEAPPASDAPAPPRERLSAWDQYPLGTKVYAGQGGHWTKEPAGWRWLSGDVFPTPGADAYRAELPASPAQEATPPREEQHQGWTKNDQQQEPKPEGEGSVCVRVSSADLAPLQIALAQAGRLGRWVCEDSLGFVEFDSQEQADEALVAAYWADCTEVTVAQADAAFRFAERHQARG